MSLESQPVLEFEGLILDPRSCVLRGRHGSIPLTRKGCAVLYCLASHAGEIVSREQLMAAVWGSIAVSENGIDQKMSEIRKRLAQAAAAPDLIQNRHGLGWCFTAAAAPVPAPDSVAPPARALPRFGAGAFALAAATIGVACLAIVVRAPRGGSTQEPRVLSYSQLTDDGRPKAAPLLTDGRFVYFGEVTATGNAMVRAVPVSAGLSPPPDPVFVDTLPLDSAPRARALLLLAPPFRPPIRVSLWNLPAGPLQTLPGIFRSFPAISPDACCLADADGHALDILRVGSPESRVSVPVAGGATLPKWSPDGRFIRFTVRDSRTDRLSLWEVDSRGRHPLRLPLDVPGAPGGVCCGFWTPDQRYFVFLDVRSDGSGENLWAIRNNTPRAAPVRLTITPMRFASAVPSVDGSKLFALGWRPQSETVRYDRVRGGWFPFWDSEPAMDIAFSRDGRAAYGRFPEHTLWVAGADGSRHQLTYPPLEAFQPHWSPDGSKLAFTGRIPGEPWRIYVVSAAGGEARLAVTSTRTASLADQGVPSWSPDGRYLVFGELRGRNPPERMMLHLVDLHTGAEAPLPHSEAKWSPRWSPDGRHIVAESADMNSLMLLSLSTGSWSKLVRLPAIDDALWSPDGRYIQFSSVRTIYRIRMADHRVERIAVEPELAVVWSGLAPDGSPLALRSTGHFEVYALNWKLP